MAGFLRETIDSVLAQGWPRLDYLVMDGGSRDGTRELLESYGDRIRWVSETDGGQADAINRGFERTRGQIFAFLNADDTYRPGALATAAAGFAANPGAAVVYGDADLVDAAGATVRPFPTEDFDRGRFQHGCFISQPATFARREAWSEVGGLNAGLRYALDYDLWIRMSEHHAFARIPGTLATSRMHPDNKSLGERGALYREGLAVVRRHFGYVPMSWLEQYARYLVDRVDQLYENSDPSRRSRAVALALGLRYNPIQWRRFWRDWQSDGCTHRFHDGWMSKTYESRQDIPANAGTLVVAGRHMADVRRPLVLTISADGVRLGRALILEHGSFERRFEVPAEMRGRPCVIRVVSAWTWRPGSRRGDSRRLSCLLDGVALTT
jgi:glycosyltransferase involved in cell wall biosynthesis